MLRTLLIAAAVLSLPILAAAQPAEALFIERSTASAARDQEAVGIQLDRLFAATVDRILLNVAGHEWVARFERIDRDRSGHRVWVGSIDGIEYSHVSFAERNGVVSGLINAVSEVYQVRTITPGRYLLDRVPVGGDQRELAPLVEAAPNVADARVAPSPHMAPDDRAVIDVLLLYTPRAVTRVGGTAQMQALVSQVLSDSNTIFARSGITTRLRLAGSQEYAYTETTSMSGDLSALSLSPVARGLRDQYRADLVQLLEETNQGGVCGIAYLLTSLGSTTFNAYSVADVDCVSQYTPTHEMGHNMGSHHAPEDDATFALFPYSFGYKDPVRGFRDVMAYACTTASCPRIPNMSNPSVAHNGGPTGTVTQNNAQSINNAADTVANFRQQGPTPTPPAAPSGLRSQISGSVVTLSWNAVDAATSYALNVGSGPGLSNIYAANVGLTTSVTGVVPGGTYFWRVLALNGAGQSPVSSESTFAVAGTPCVAPAPPSGFTFALAGRVVSLTWAPPATGTPAFTYLLEVGGAPAQANLYSASVGGLTALSVQAPPGTYFVRVRAQNVCGTSPASLEQVIVVP